MSAVQGKITAVLMPCAPMLKDHSTAHVMKALKEMVSTAVVSFPCKCDFTQKIVHGHVSIVVAYSYFCLYIMVDINECTLEEPVCDEFATCANTDGSFYCTCDFAYTGNGDTCTREDTTT